MTLLGLAFSLSLLVSGGPGPVPPTGRLVGSVQRVRNDVRHLPATTTRWLTAKVGVPVYTGDQVETRGDDARAALTLKDGTVIRLNPNTRLTVADDEKGGVEEKTISVTQGAVGFLAGKQRPNERLTFGSPTSVASIRGTSGFFTDRELLILEGVAEHRSTTSDQTVTVSAGEVSFVNADGSIAKRPATPVELTDARRALPLSASGEQRGGTSGPIRKLRIEYLTRQGQKRAIEVEYRELQTP